MFSPAGVVFGGILKVNRLIKIIAVTLSASLLLFGCSMSERQISDKESTDMKTTEQQKGSSVMSAEELTAESNVQPSEAEDVVELTDNNIHINQIGYRTADRKQIIVSGEAAQFTVVDKITGAQAFVGPFTKGSLDNDSGDMLYYGDFTEVKTAGTYFIEVPGIGQTDSFVIGDKVYDELKAGHLKSFYYQRCGMELKEEFAGVWSHPACHTGKGKIYGDESAEIDGNGGWHDAGDYGKYVVPGAVAAADLLMTWELFPDSYGDSINTPESGNGIPDILDEARVELEWLLKMQDQNTGGVYHKLTSKGFPPLVMMPQNDLSELFYAPVSAAATGDFAAVTAMASRIYKDFDGKFAKACLDASIYAWSWLENNGLTSGFTNPRDINTGEYGDGNDSDERIWAAAELYRATGNAVYDEYIKSSYKNSGIEYFGFGWQSVGGYAAVAYMFTDKQKVDQTVYDYFKKCLINEAGYKQEKSRSSGYHITLGPDDYYWGSNSVVLNDARLLIIADMFEPSVDYIEIAMNNFNYILGLNTLDQCYVTGFGHKPVMNPHHRPSKGDDEELPVPGMIAGGPNSDLQDDIALMNLKGLPPAKCYIDHSGSYSTNEVAVYWNSPAVFVAAYFDK